MMTEPEFDCWLGVFDKHLAKVNQRLDVLDVLLEQQQMLLKRLEGILDEQ
ncbi:hypothetical protein ACE02H_14755 [Shewanella mangrovisoli]